MIDCGMRGRTCRLTLYVFLVFSLCLILPSLLMAQKTDVIYADNGDRITGKIVKLERGILEYKTDNLSTLRVKWEYVVRLSSNLRYDIELESGARYIGTIEQAEEVGKMVIRVSEDIDYTVDLSSVVKIYPLRSNFWKRVTGYLDAGLSFQRANHRTEWKLGGEVNYRGERWHYRTVATSYYSNRQGVEGTTRNDASVTGQRILKNRWIAVLATTHEQNDELNLDYRALVGGAFGRFLVQSNRQILAAYAGVTGTREKYTDSEDIGYNAEVMISARYEAFKYDSPKLDLSPHSMSSPASPRGAVSGQIFQLVSATRSFVISSSL